ncbi:MAG: SRPBCC family protein [Actinobacteria bacterium]|nr:SRPBCC family protein [Actinomycetota bacterium]
MSRIRVSVLIHASPRRVWSAVEDIASHVEWMQDAAAIRFTSPRRSGVGTTFECLTRVGPFRLTDKMVVTEWKPRRVMGIRHTGLVTGTGRFTLRRQLRGGTRFTWEERLDFPWWMGGPLGGGVGSVVLRRIWRHNLANLRRRVEATP